jgi:hypothetical protein
MYGTGRHEMRTLLTVPVLVMLIFTGAFAQEKSVDNMNVDFGIISWEDIREFSTDKPAAHSEDFHRKMAKTMFEMHGGGSKGTYHVMVMLSDKLTGKEIENATVTVTAVEKAGSKKITQNLKPMSMDGFSGYGEFYKMKSRGTYVFKVKIDNNYNTYKTEFERTVR